jgi:two-component system, cell cycle response regulator DivK
MNTPVNTKNATILCVEDNTDNRLLARRILEAEGYRFLEASDAAAALQLIVEQIPDLILMDINMPGMDGYALTAHLRSMPQMQYVPILALTANVMKGDCERSLAAGCDGYIQKPIDVDRLPKQVGEFLAPRQ